MYDDIVSTFHDLQLEATVQMSLVIRLCTTGCCKIGNGTKLLDSNLFIVDQLIKVNVSEKQIIILAEYPVYYCYPSNEE